MHDGALQRSHRPLATSHLPVLNPHSGLPRRGWSISDANHEPQALCQLQSTIHKPQTSGHEPQTAYYLPLFPDSTDEAREVVKDPRPLLRVTSKLRLLSIDQPQATSYQPRTAFLDPPDEAGHAGRGPGSMPEEKPVLGFCPTKTLERSGFQPFSYGRAPKSEHGVHTGHRP